MPPKTHHRKVNALQENIQFIKELQKTKSLKQLGHVEVQSSVVLQKKSIHAKGHGDKLGHMASKSLVQGQMPSGNLGSKVLIGQQSTLGHSKKLSKADMSSKFLAGVKGGHQH